MGGFDKVMDDVFEIQKYQDQGSNLQVIFFPLRRIVTQNLAFLGSSDAPKTF
jgi:hypothetical protein